MTALDSIVPVATQNLELIFAYIYWVIKFRRNLLQALRLCVILDSDTYQATSPET